LTHTVFTGIVRQQSQQGIQTKTGWYLVSYTAMHWPLASAHSCVWSEQTCIL